MHLDFEFQSNILLEDSTVAFDENTSMNVISKPVKPSVFNFFYFFCSTKNSKMHVMKGFDVILMIGVNE